MRFYEYESKALFRRHGMPLGESRVVNSSDEAREAFEAKRQRLDVPGQMEAHFLLWEATGDAAHLEEAGRVLDEMLENTPEEYRETMRSDVPLHDSIERARHGRR